MMNFKPTEKRVQTQLVLALAMLLKSLFQQAVPLPWQSALFFCFLLCVHIIS